MPASITDSLKSGQVLLLDGATGTELSRRGVSIDRPEWSASALWEHAQLVSTIHQDYVASGADIITANTFRTHARNLRHTEYSGRSAELIRRAVELARQAAGPHVWVAGSQAPLEDCYCPELTPSDAELRREHREMSQNLASAGVDLILVETQNTIREALAATTSAVETGLPVLVSFVCNRQGRLLSGETVSAAAYAVAARAPAGILANCLPADVVPQVLREMQGVCRGIATGAYANVGFVDEHGRWVDTDAVSPRVYAAMAQQWLKDGVSIAGGCCGTTPAHIAELRRRIDQTGARTAER